MVSNPVTAKQFEDDKCFSYCSSNTKKEKEGTEEYSDSGYVYIYATRKLEARFKLHRVRAWTDKAQPRFLDS